MLKINNLLILIHLNYYFDDMWIIALFGKIIDTD